MNLDQMLEAWRTQDAAPPYSVNSEALRRMLQAEAAAVRRVRRRDMWIVCIAGIGLAVFAGLWLSLLIYQDKPALYIVAAAIGFCLVVPWISAYCVSRWRQTRQERNFGNTLQEELKRALSRLDIEISRFTPWTRAMLWIAPVMVGSTLIAWAVSGSQGDGTDALFGGWWIYPAIAFWTLYLVRIASRFAKEKLEPRRQRLRELLAALESRE